MKTLLLAVLCVVLGVAPALASNAVQVEKLAPLSDKTEKKVHKDKPAKAEEAEPVTPEQQALLVCQTADIMGAGAAPVAGPDYVPGVDAYGKPVAPADGGAASPFVIPDQIEVPVNIDVMQAMGITAPAGRDMKANFGTLTVFKGGKLLYNGQDISNSVDGYCRTHLPKTEEKK